MQLVYANQVWIAMGAGVGLFLVVLYFALAARLAIREIGLKAVTHPELSQTIVGLSEELARVRSEISEMKKKHEPVNMVPEGLALNLNTRGHILRLYRRGESIADIARALRLTKGEVNLIVRVHEISRLSSSDNPVKVSV